MLAVACGNEAELRFPATDLEFLLQGAVSALDPLTGERAFSPDSTSRLAVSLDREVATLIPSGAVQVEGGDCPNASCAISINSLALATDDFDLGDSHVTDTRIDSTNVMTGTKKSDGSFILGRMSIRLTASGRVERDLRTATYLPQNDVGGTLNLSTGWMTIFGNATRE